MEDPMISGLRQTSDMQDMETQASPSLLSIRQSDLKIIIDDFPEDQMKPSASAKKQSNIQFITKMIDRIKSLARKKKVSGNINEYNTCHSCRGLLERNLLICCSVTDCQRYFCFRCLNKKFNVTPEMIYDILTSSNWNCVSCKGLCNCKICKDRFFGKSREFPAELTRFEKSKKKQTDFSIKVETDHASDLNAVVKREFIDDQSSTFMQPHSLTSPGLSMLHSNQTKQEAGQDDTILFQIYPTFKPRSKSIAKKLLNERRKLRGGNSNESDSEGDVEVFKSPKSVSMENRRQKYRKRVKEAAKVSTQECHMCGHQISAVNMAICSVEGCKKGYCIDCIHQTYQEDFDLQNYNPECWICYSCGGACECAKCKRRRPTGRKPHDSIKLQEDLLAMQAYKKGSKINEKRRIKYYDTSSDEEDEGDADGSIEEEQEQGLRKRSEEVFKVPKFEKSRPKKQLKTETKEEFIEEPVKPKSKRGRKKKIEVKQEIENIKEEDEEEEEFEIDHENEEKELPVNEKFIKKKQVKSPPVIEKESIDESKIISETSIDYACITLYDAENEEELKNQVQMKFEMEEA